MTMDNSHERCVNCYNAYAATAGHCLIRHRRVRSYSRSCAEYKAVFPIETRKERKDGLRMS